MHLMHSNSAHLFEGYVTVRAACFHRISVYRSLTRQCVYESIRLCHFHPSHLLLSHLLLSCTSHAFPFLVLDTYAITLCRIIQYNTIQYQGTEEGHAKTVEASIDDKDNKTQNTTRNTITQSPPSQKKEEIKDKEEQDNDVDLQKLFKEEEHE